MAGQIPFVRDMDFDYGAVTEISPLVRRVIANNPGPFTFTGTGVYIVGRGTVAVIDPGPDTSEHFEALKKALEGETVSHVIVTHHHMDHSPLAHPLAEWAGCKVYGKPAPRHEESAVQMDAGSDHGFKPHVELNDGDVLKGPGWTLETIETPGHTSNHLCFALREENALFSGDHIMGWSTTVISPPDGDMRDYFESLDKVRARSFDTLIPTHGPPITDDVDGFIGAYINHRRAREASILERLKAGDTTIPDMVKVIYADVDSRLHPAACHSVLGHMIHLVKDGHVSVTGSMNVSGTYTLTK